MIKWIAAPEDAAAAQRIKDELGQLGVKLGDAGAGLSSGDVLIAVVSQQALQRSPVKDTVIAALERDLHVALVQVGQPKLPRMVDHLFSVAADDPNGAASLKQFVDEAQAAGARMPLKVLTPSVQKANRRAGIVIGVIALVVFVLGLYGVGVLRIQAPIREFNSIDTMVALTRDVIVEPALEQFNASLPENAETAVGYPATLRAVPTAWRPLVALTATQYAFDGYTLYDPNATLPAAPAIITLTPTPEDGS